MKDKFFFINLEFASFLNKNFIKCHLFSTFKFFLSNIMIQLILKFCQNGDHSKLKAESDFLGISTKKINCEMIKKHACGIYII